MESKKARIQRQKFMSKKRLAASERAHQRWSKTVSCQQSRSEPSSGGETRTLDEHVIAVQPGSASTPPAVGYVVMSSGENTAFQPGSAPAVPGKSGVPSPIGEIGSQDMASTGTAPEEVSLAPHVSSVQGGIVSPVSSVVGGNTSVVCSPVECSTPKSLPSHVQGGVTPVCTTESQYTRFQRDLSSVIEDSAFTSVLSSGGSTYVPTPLLQSVKRKFGSISSKPVEISEKLYMGNACQVLEFVENINVSCRCATPGCKGSLMPHRFISKGLGGAIKVFFVCNGCWVQTASFNSSLNYEGPSSACVVGFALQVAFLISGRTYADYNRAVNMCLGMSGISPTTFYQTIKYVYEPVLDILEEQCRDAIADMKAMGDKELGSFARAVTTGDGVWHTRKFSKNCTFTVRNFMNNSLLYYVHLCMKGRDKVVPGELYQGTSHSAEGIGADLAFKHARADGMHIEVHWQDGDSSSAKSFHKHYPDEQRSRVMQCGGHVAKNFQQQLERAQKRKSVAPSMQKQFEKRSIETKHKNCCCIRNHKQACGCLTPAFVKKARINFHSSLVNAGTSPEAFSRIMKDVGSYHCRDVHEWENGGHCSFHKLRLCTCEKCGDGEVLCEGKPYHTKVPLTCEYHQLEFELECHKRADMAEALIHPVLGKGHTNLPESSHSILIRFRTKDVALGRLHYITSTNLGLLQANLSYMHRKRGPAYHWILDLFRRLKLPVTTEMEDTLRMENERRIEKLEAIKQDDSKKQRRRFKNERDADQQRRMLWVQKQKVSHHYGMGESDSDDDGDTDHHPPSATVKQKIVVVCNTAKQCKCGSTTHLRITSKHCPLNPKGGSQANLIVQDIDECDSDDNRALSESESSDGDDTVGDNYRDCYDDVYSDEECVCTCGAYARSHHRTCPMNPRFVGQPHSKPVPDEFVLNMVRTVSQGQVEPQPVAPQPVQLAVSQPIAPQPVMPQLVSPQPVAPKLIAPQPVPSVRFKQPCVAPVSVQNTVSLPNPRRRLFSVQGGDSSSSKMHSPVSPCNKRKDDSEKSDCLPPSKKPKPAAEAIDVGVGSYVCVHGSSLGQQHLVCRVAAIVGEKCHLCCGTGLLSTCYFRKELTLLSGNHQISLARWRIFPKLSLGEAASEAANVEPCVCTIVKKPVVDLTGGSPAPVVASDTVWVDNLLYKLDSVDKQTVVKSTGWLTDSVITATQLLMLQQCPRMRGLQPPTLAHSMQFDVHGTQQFVQIINIRSGHWCVVSNVGCVEGVVGVYDSMYPSVGTSTIRVIASLMFCSSPTLSIQMMNVALQTNGSDCGVLAIANAYEICSGRDPCKVKYGDTASIREHLATCLNECMLTPFPNVGKRRCMNRVKSTQTVKIHCQCRLPEEVNVPIAQCDVCKCWFHKHCLDIPQTVFEAESIFWACTSCKR